MPEALAASLLLAFVACGADAAQLRAGARRASCRGSGADPWNYADGGASWRIGQCCDGSGQSPLNLSAVVRRPPDGNKLFFGYQASRPPSPVVNDGHAVRAALDPSIGGFAIGTAFPAALVSRFDAWRVVVHTPSEHTFEGRRLPLELQVFHRRRGNLETDPAAGDIAVLAVGFEAAAALGASPGAKASTVATSPPSPSEWLDALASGGLPMAAGASTASAGGASDSGAPANADYVASTGLASALDTAASAAVAPPGGTVAAQGGPPIVGGLLAAVSVADLLGVRRDHAEASANPEPPEFLWYEGSLTAPPCSRGVTWVVRRDPIQATAATIASFQAAATAITPLTQADPGNARALQPSCGRDATPLQSEDVSEMLGFEPEAQGERALKAAAVEAERQQASFEAAEDALEGPAKLYEECMHRLGSAARDLQAARERRSRSCGAASDARDAMSAADAGVGQLAAAARRDGLQAHCDGDSMVVSRLADEIARGQQQCRKVEDIDAK